MRSGTPWIPRTRARGTYHRESLHFVLASPCECCEDSMGALAARAQLHNSKGVLQIRAPEHIATVSLHAGFALMKLEPPRTAQARREFVRAVTSLPQHAAWDAFCLHVFCAQVLA